MRTSVAVVFSVIFASTVVAADYLPLQEGNRWVFSITNGPRMTMQVTGFAEVGKVRCAIVKTLLGSQENEEYVAVDTQGVKAYLLHSQGQEFRYDQPILRIKLPYREGESWTTVVSPFGTPTTTVFESIGKERVETPAGTFDCIKVRSTVNPAPGQPPQVFINYYAEGIGPVRQVMQMGGQEMVATLLSIGLPPAQRQSAAAQPPAAGKIRCPKCGAEVNADAKFCPRCGQKMTASLPVAEPNRPTQAPPAKPSALEKYQSSDGKVLLYKPKDWNVTQGDMFGPATYGVRVMEPQKNAVVLFTTFAVSPEIQDSVVLAARCIAALRQTYPDLQATNVQSTPRRERTIADLSLTAEGEDGTGHGYFFRTKDSGSVYILLAKTKRWNELRPTLTTIAANLAYAPQGIAAVQQEARQPTGAASTTASPISPLAAMLKRAAEQPGKQMPLVPATLTDQSLSLQIPEGWALEGGRVQYAAINDAQTRTYGVGSIGITIIPTEFSAPGVISVPYQPPPQALKTILESGKSTRDVQVIEECPVEQAVPALSQMVQQMRSQGSQVDARLIHVRFRNVATGATCRGLFCVICSIKPGSPVWQVSLQGSWAPDQEFEQWLPLFLQVERSVQVNQQWMSQEMQDQAVRQQQLNHNLQKSIAESSRAFDDYMASVRAGERSRDYTSHMWSQTTLGQGAWVAESEGAKIYQTDSWGLEGPEGRIDGKAYNTANFTGENPWIGGKMELVDTRAEYEKYLANR